MPESRRVVLVGHCGPDVYRLKAAVSRAVPDAAIHSVEDDTSLHEHLSSEAVLLVNRVLFGAYSKDCGIELIRRIAAGQDPPTLILVSNYEDAQAEAVAAGARPGFGKDGLFDDRTATILREAAKR